MRYYVVTALPADVTPVPVRPIPDDDSWYETTWREWLEGRIFLEGE